MTLNQRLVRRAITEVFNSGRLDVANDLFAVSYKNHGGLIPDLLSGPEAVKLSVAVFRRAFPHMRITINALETDDGVLVLDWTARNRRRGATPTFQADRSTPDHVTGSTRVRCAEGLIAESWTDWDSSLMLKHLGLEHSN